jgi:hypothetical protein
MDFMDVDLLSLELQRALDKVFGAIPHANPGNHHMLFDNDKYVVVAVEHPGLSEKNVGYTIVLKNENKEVFLHGKLADGFAILMQAWKEATPTEEDVELALESFTQLDTLPMVLH